MTPYHFSFRYPFAQDGNLIPGCQLVFRAEGRCRKGGKQCQSVVILTNEKPTAAGGTPQFFDWLYQRLTSPPIKLPAHVAVKEGGISRTARTIRISFLLKPGKSDSGPTAVEEMRACLVGLQEWIANLVPTFKHEKP